MSKEVISIMELGETPGNSRKGCKKFRNFIHYTLWYVVARLLGAFIIGFCTTKGNLPYKLSVPMHVKPSKPGSQLEKRFLNERHSHVT